MVTIDVTAAERASGKLAGESHERAVQAMKRDGVVVLHNAVERAHADALASKMREDTAAILARDDVPFNFNTGNIQQDPPPFPPYLFRDVLVNDLAIAITRAILGPGMKNAFYSGNTALPNSASRQPVHVDVGQLWPNLDVATPPYALVVNVLPVDVSPENGSTEIWPGTHTDTTLSIQDGDLKIPLPKVEARRAEVPPIQPTAPAGSIVIRDIRLWHAGMPNRTGQPRPMIAMIHYVSWWSDLAPIVFPKGCEDVFQHPDLGTHARFVDGEIDYLRRHQAFDLQK